MMLRSTIEKFYDFVFSDEDQKEEVPYTNKAFMFYFSIAAFIVVAVLIGLDIAENISENLK